MIYKDFQIGEILFDEATDRVMVVNGQRELVELLTVSKGDLHLYHGFKKINTKPLKVEINGDCYVDSQGHQTKPSLADERLTTVKANQDVNLARDGLLASASKMWWTWTHGQEIEDARVARETQRFQQEFRRGNESVESQLALIAGAETRVAQKLAQLGAQPLESNWTEDDQRHRNDIYWMTGGRAFWLNPSINGIHGFNLLADALPAPNWWREPAHLQIAEAQGANVVARSLLVPREDAKGTSGDDPMAPIFSDDFEVDVQRYTSLSETYLYFAQQKNGLVLGFTTERGGAKWVEENQGGNHVIARRGSTLYGELLREFARHNLETKTEHLDAVIAELNRLGELPTPVIKSHGARKDFFMVETGGHVRGFTSKDDADRWVKSQREEAIQKALSLERENQKKALHATKLRQEEAQAQLNHHTSSKPRLPNARKIKK